MLDINQSPAIENKKAPMMSHVSLEGFSFLKLRIRMIKIPIPADPDLKIKFEVINANIADTTDNNKTP